MLDIICAILANTSLTSSTVSRAHRLKGAMEPIDKMMNRPDSNFREQPRFPPINRLLLYGINIKRFSLLPFVRDQVLF